MIDLRTCTADELLADMADESCDLVCMDPPWGYSNAAPPGHGRILLGKGERPKDSLNAFHYAGLDIDGIAQTFARAHRVARPDCYGLVWCTFPFLEDWIFTRRTLDGGAPPRRRWEHVSGATWRKNDARRGIGMHFLGDCEPALLYRKGKPKPQQGPISNAWNWPRRAHSAKPLEPLADLLRFATPPGGLVLDLYAGESASLARACMLTGRSYVGAEADPARAAAARAIIETVRT